jgi:CRP/FNR family cyclic AMP-dependent transcriptional regulator
MFFGVSMMSLTPILKETDIFYELTPTQLELIASICTTQEFNSGDVIFTENSASAELYVVAEGEVDIQVDTAIFGRGNTGKLVGPRTVATFRIGQSFGEVALLDEGLRSATARCSKNGTTLIIIPRERLLMLCDMYPQLGYRLMYNLATDLATKIRGADMKIREEIMYNQQK